MNQAAIEKNLVHSPDGKWVVGFQSKYYKDSISKHKSKILDSITNTKKYYPSVNKYFFYTNDVCKQLAAFKVNTFGNLPTKSVTFNIKVRLKNVISS